MDVHNLIVKISKEKSQEKSAVRLTRREIREATGWTMTQVAIHLTRLVELEYLIPHQTGRGIQGVYELAYDGEGQDGSTFLSGLVDPETLISSPYDANLSAQNHHLSAQTPNLSGSNRPQIGIKSGGYPSDFSGEAPIKKQEETSKDYNFNEKRTSGCENSDSSRSHNHRQRSAQESDDGEPGPDDGQLFPCPVEGR